MKTARVKQPAPPTVGKATQHRGLQITAVLTILSSLAAAIVWADWYYGVPDDAQATFVGRQSCIQCHEQQHAAWTGSHHDLAMDRATDESVLGDFGGATLEHYGVRSRMFKRDGRFFINTEGPDGKNADFEIKYVFGVDPLQQYMVEFDRPADMPADEVARLQVLRVSWDTKAKKWFHLDPPDVAEKLDPSDDLHWTGVAQRWNNMCADCHSTNLKKNFDVATRTYHTTWSEIDVSCEACHGPGSHHVMLAREISPFWDRKRGFALASLKGQGTHWTATQGQIQACAPCHSRRRTIHGDYTAGCNYHDHFAGELLTRTSYHADGQILDEVYEYGSFVQSKMYHKGVRCTDCHDPHTARLKHEGNKVCTSCHQHTPAKYDTTAHHRHAEGKPGASCVNCHMPETTYMAVDPRRDHSFRVPRPDLSAQFGTPNSCTGCHLRDERLPGANEEETGDRGQWTGESATVLARADLKAKEYADWLRAAAQGDEQVKLHLGRVDRWAAATLDRWYGANRKREAHFAEALHAARTQASDAQEKLIAVLQNRDAPAIARATAAVELGAYAGLEKAADSALTESLTDRDPSIRSAAVTSLRISDPNDLYRTLAPALSDDSRSVRVEAARVMAQLPQAEFRGATREAMESALEEAVAAWQQANDRADGHRMVGVLLESLRNDAEAEQAYRTAIRIEPEAVGPRANLSQLLDRRRAEVISQVQQLVQSQNVAAAQELLARAGPLEDEANRLRNTELSLLERDALLLPDSAGLQTRLGFLRYLQGWRKEAQQSLHTAYLMEPQSPDHSYALAIFWKDTGRPRDALPLLQQLRRQRPQDREIENLETDVKQMLRAGPAP